MEEKTNVMRILDQKKINYKSHYYGDSGAVSGLEVARVLGEDPSRVFKTLVTEGKSRNYYVFMIPVAERKVCRNGQIQRIAAFDRLHTWRMFTYRDEKIL